MNETPANQTPEVAEQARRADYPSTGAPTQPTGSIPPGYPPIPPPSDQPSYPPQAAYPQDGAYKQASWSRPRPFGGSVVGPLLLIGAGVLFLLNNLGIVDSAVWGSLWRLWPLALVAVGLDLLFGRRRPWLSTLIVLLLLVASVGLLFYTGFGSGGKLNTYNLNVPIAGAKSASVDINFGTGDLTVDSQANNEDLVGGTLEYYSDSGSPRVNVDQTGDTGSVTIRSNEGFHLGFFNLGSTRGPHWDIHLNPAVSTSLKADLGAGNTILDLSKTKLTGLVVNGGAGNSTVTFPQITAQTSATIDGGVGNLTLHIPEGTEARITVDSGIGNVNVDDRFTKL
jgi:N-terminal domain of toast_rack, DUF2154/Domain of unknown function (DUF5668)